MKNGNKTIYLIRHGETAWTISNQHTGLTDLPLTDSGRKEALLLKEKLKPYHFDHVFVSQLKRAKETCELSGYLNRATVDPDLSEWHYGNYEGLTNDQIK